MTALAAGVRYWFAARAGFSAANDIDGPVYFGGAVELVHGKIPYRDFAFVQPPLTLLLAAPFAFLSRFVGTGGAFTVVRVVMPLVGVVNVFLVGRRVRHRGPIAVLVAGGALAVYLPAILSTRTLLLEPLLDLGCLLGVTFAFDENGVLERPRRLLLAGVFMGLAVCVKLWGVFPLAVLLAFCLSYRPRWRHAGVLAVGAAVGFGVPSLPFVMLSPSQFIHDIVFSQVNRLRLRMPFTWRMGEVFGLTEIGKPRAIAVSTIVLGFAIAAVILLCTARALVRLRRRASPLSVYCLVSAVVVFAVLMVPGEFPYHYPDPIGPFAAVTFGLAAGTLAERWGARPRVARITFAVLAVGVAGVTVNDVGLLPTGPSSSVTALARVIPPGACVITDYTAALIAENRFVSSDPACPIIVDPFGLDLTLDNGQTPRSSGHYTPAVVAFWLSAFEHANWVVLTPSASARIVFSRSVREYLKTDFALVSPTGIAVYKRVETPPEAEGSSRRPRA